MLLLCLECNYKCGNIAVLKYHYESFHKVKTDKCICGNIILSGICANDFSPWGCSLKNESSSSSNSSSNPSSNSNPNSNSSSNPSSSSSSSSGSGSNPSSSSSSGFGPIYDYNSNSDPKPNPNPNLIPNPNPNLIPNPNLNPSSEVLTRCCNKCNYIKPLNNFDEGKYTCRNCTSAKVNCPYCTSVVRYDGIRAHVMKQHPDIELTRGFSRNLQSRFPDITERSVELVPRSDITQTGDLRICKATPLSSYTDSCSCKFYNFVSFLI